MTGLPDTNTRGDSNIAMIVEIAGWASGYQIGSDAEKCMKAIVAAMQREGYLPEGKRRIINCEHEIKELENVLRVLIREAQAVADDHHRPRYSRLDEALESAKAALTEIEGEKP